VKAVRVLMPVALAGLIVACGGSSTGGGSANGASAPGVTATTINIGMEADLTVNTTVGLGGQLGVRMAISEINAHGGINGRKLVLTTEDSMGSADGGVSAMRKLLDEDNPFVLIECSTSDATIPVLPEVESTGIPFMVTAAADPRILAPFNKWVYLGTGVPVPSLVSEYVNLVKYLNASNVGFLVTSGAFPTSEYALLKPAMVAAGINVVGETTASTTATDFTSQVEAIKQMSPTPDLVFTIGGGGTFIKQLRQAGITVPLIADASQTTPQLISLAGGFANGVYSFWEYATQLLSATTPPMSNFLSEFGSEFNPVPAGMPNYFVLEGYEDMYALAYAIEKDGKNPTRDGVDQQLDQLNKFVAGVNGAFPYAFPVGVPLTFTSSQHQGNTTVLPLQVQNGQYVVLQGAPSTTTLTPNVVTATPTPSPAATPTPAAG
jgi:branched-chain amino acid transport system substrate-binding protein